MWTVRSEVTDALLQWSDYKDEFDFDGSWRDIYVLDTTLADWQLLLDFLYLSNYEVRYTINSEIATLPLYVNEVFELKATASPFLEVKVSEVALNCHFFCIENIEFDFDPREAQSPAEVQLVFTFLGQLVHALQREAVITPENYEEMPIFRLLPDSDCIRYLPPRFGT